MKFAALALALASALAAAGSAPHAAPSVHTLPDVVITNGFIDAFGVTVYFSTDNEPPYLVGLFDSLDAQFAASSTSRAYPLAYRVVEEKQATLWFPVRSVRNKVFVQVVPVAWTNGATFAKRDVAWFEHRHRTMKGTFDEVLLDSGDKGTWIPYPTVDGCSQEVPIRAMFKSLSASDGKRIGVDWVGDVKFIAAPDAVQGRIYWEGL